MEPGIEIFEVYKALKKDRVLAEQCETYWIQHYTALGASLLNSQKRGDLLVASVADLIEEEKVFLRFESPDDFMKYLSDHPDTTLGSW